MNLAEKWEIGKRGRSQESKSKIANPKSKIQKSGVRRRGQKVYSIGTSGLNGDFNHFSRFHVLKHLL
jgi:hypothetical protein